jgi:hypothetical protein
MQPVAPTLDQREEGALLNLDGGVNEKGQIEKSVEILLEKSASVPTRETKEKSKGKEGNKPKPAEMKIGRHSLVVNAELGIRYSVRKFFHQFMSVLSINGSPDYLLGVQIAGVLQRKTFNLYHCMKKKHIELRRASQDQIEFLMSVSAVPIGTHSVTFVPIADGLCFIADALYRYVRFPNEDPSSFILKKRRSYAAVKHKITRRKPLPWDLQRSIKKEQQPTHDGADPQNYYIQSEEELSKPSFESYSSLPLCRSYPVSAPNLLQPHSLPPVNFPKFLEAISS